MKVWLFVPLALFFLLSSLSCSADEEVLTRPTKKPKVVYTPKQELGPTGHIKGVIITEQALSDGVEQIPLSEAEKCGIPGQTERQKGAVKIHDGKVENAIVFLSGIKEGKDFGAKETKVSNSHCSYQPRVNIGYVGGKMLSPNMDKTNHNIMVKGNYTYSSPALEPEKTDESKLKKAGLASLSCSLHGWMQGYVYVLENPYGEKTNANGEFEIRDIPPGTYTLNVWHEKLEKSSREVTIQADASTDLGEITL